MEVDVASAAERPSKPYKGLAMEGIIATWYAKVTGKRIAADLQSGDSVLEIAAGPGYLGIELARLGSYRIVGLDYSRTFVRIARENAGRAGVEVDFRHGDASALPF